MLLSVLMQATLAIAATIPVLPGGDAGMDVQPSIAQSPTDAMFPNPSLLAPQPIMFDVEGTNLAIEVTPLRPYRRPLGSAAEVYGLIDAFDQKARSSADQHQASEPIDVKRIGVAHAGLTFYVEPREGSRPVRDVTWSDLFALVDGLRQHFRDVYFWPSRLYLFDQKDPKTGDFVIGVGYLLPFDNPLSNDTRVVSSN